MGTYNSNQFGMKNELGTLDLTTGGISTAFTVRFNPKSTTAQIEAGQAVKLVDIGTEHTAGPPIVDVAAPDEVAFGARLFMPKAGVTKPGEIMEISADGCIQILEANAAIPAGSAVRFVPANPGRIAAQGTFNQFGILLDQAKVKTDGHLVRVLIKPLVKV